MSFERWRLRSQTSVPPASDFRASQTSDFCASQTSVPPAAGSVFPRLSKEPPSLIADFWLRAGV